MRSLEDGDLLIWKMVAAKLCDDSVARPYELIRLNIHLLQYGTARLASTDATQKICMDFEEGVMSVVNRFSPGTPPSKPKSAS